MKKLMIQSITTMIALGLSMMTSASLAGSAAHSAKPATTDAAKKAPSFLFVIDAKQGEIKKDKNGQFHLVLKHADMNHAIMFSDRPNRIVKYITAEQLQALWKEGNDSFEVDPPNAVLSGSGIMLCYQDLGLRHKS